MIDCRPIMYADVIGDLKINVSETKYLKYQQNIEGNSSFRISKCNFFLSSLAHILIFSSMLVFCQSYFHL